MRFTKILFTLLFAVASVCVVYCMDNPEGSQTFHKGTYSHVNLTPITSSPGIFVHSDKISEVRESLDKMLKKVGCDRTERYDTSCAYYLRFAATKDGCRWYIQSPAVVITNPDKYCDEYVRGFLTKSFSSFAELCGRLLFPAYEYGHKIAFKKISEWFEEH